MSIKGSNIENRFSYVAFILLMDRLVVTLNHMMLGFRCEDEGLRGMITC